MPTVFITRVPITGCLFSDSESVFTYPSVSLSFEGVISTGGSDVSTFTVSASVPAFDGFQTGITGMGLVAKFFCHLFCMCACAQITAVDGPSDFGLILIGVVFLTPSESSASLSNIGA